MGELYPMRGNKKNVDDPLLPIKPFQSWLKKITKTYSQAEIARRAGISERRVWTLLHGKQRSHKVKGRIYKLKFIQLSTVEKFMIPFDSHPYLIYDIDEIEGQVHDE